MWKSIGSQIPFMCPKKRNELISSELKQVKFKIWRLYQKVHRNINDCIYWICVFQVCPVSSSPGSAGAQSWAQGGSGGAAEPQAEEPALDWAGPAALRQNQQHRPVPRRALLKLHHTSTRISPSHPFFSIFPSFLKLSKDMLEIRHSWGLLILGWKDRFCSFRKTQGKWSPTTCGSRV